MRRLIGFFLALGAAARGDNLPPPAEQKLAREIYAELVGINTSPSGATTPAAEAVAKRLRAAGFTDVQVLAAKPKIGNVVARYRGTGKQKPLLLLAHLDVVEARRDDWSMEPYQLSEKDGYFYGRGTGDDKAQAAHWTANLIRYKREGYKPDRDLILALTSGEEGGGPDNGVKWLIANHRNLIDAEYCLNEGGWGELRGGKPTYNAVQVSEKLSVNFRVEVRNKGGHSSVPVKENAIYRLAMALEKVSKLALPIELNNVTREYFRKLASLESGQIADDLKAVAAGSKEAAARTAAAVPLLNSLLRTTCVATRLDGGHADNALPQTAGANVNCRILPGQDPEQIQRELKRAIGDEQVTVSTAGALNEAGPSSAMRPDVMQTVERITSSMWPGVPAIPIMVMGGTDGKFLRSAGIPTYGVMGLFLDRDDMRFHGRDERVGVKEFYEAQTFLYRLVKELAGGR